MDVLGHARAAGQEIEIVALAAGRNVEALARQGDCPSVARETIPGADHVFAGRDGTLAEAVVAWLDGRL